MPPRALEQCRDEGAVLHVTACRRDDALQWRVVNQGSRPLWVFLRMPSMRDDSLADTNALVTGAEGHLVVARSSGCSTRRTIPTGRGCEPALAGSAVRTVSQGAGSDPSRGRFGLPT